MRKWFYKVAWVMAVTVLLTGCSSEMQVDNGGTQYETTTSVSSRARTRAEAEATREKNTEQQPKEYATELLPEELGSVQVRTLSTEHIYYDEVVTFDATCTEYIQEISIYDKEIDDTFLIHLSLPPNYDEAKQYPMVVMTDGVWRLSDHVELRPLMSEGQIEEVIMVSIGYPNDYDYNTIRERDLVKDPESYLHFIVDNLIPYLRDNYSVSEENMTLTGHSYGGYWAFYALFHSDTIGKNTFQNYYVGSPSFQAHTNYEFIKDHEEAYHERSKELDCNVYITVGSKEGYSFIAPIEGFVEDLKGRNYSGLNVTYEKIEGHGHDTVFKPSIASTLRMFYGK